MLRCILGRVTTIAVIFGCGAGNDRRAHVTHWLVSVVATLGGIVAAGPAGAESPSPLVLQGATIIDGTGADPLHNGTVIIEGGRITSIGPASNVHPPRGARIVDVTGKYIIPGLMDANVHFDFGLTPEYLFGYDNRYDELVLEGAQIELKNGVTTVFDTWGPREPLVKVRNAITAGQLVGSRMYIAGNIIGMGGPTSTDFLAPIRGVISKVDADRIDAIWEQGVGADLLWRTPAQVREAVRKYIQTGQIDFIKYLASGHQEMQFIAFSPDAQKVIVEEAHRAGMTAQAHSTSPESLKLEIDAGADLLQHCDVSGLEPIPDETIKLIVDRHLPCAALVVTDKYLAWSEAHAQGVMKAITKVKDDNDRKLIAAGAVLLLTTDGGLMGPKAESNPLMAASLAGVQERPNELGDAHVLWLKAVIQRGMTPMNALLAATRNIAQAYGKAQDLGTLERGKRADLVVLEADPLADPSNYQRIVDVYKDGNRVNRDALPTKRIMSRP
jgi:imidazolonepropionase-like amidohydrolase